MLKTAIRKHQERYEAWKLVHTGLGGLVALLALAFVITLLLPVRPASDLEQFQPAVAYQQPTNLAQMLRHKQDNFPALSTTARSGLFKATSGLSDRPMAEKTIERIKSQLTLQCVMELHGEPVAYINIKGIGLKKCKVGDCINDLFTVLNISKESVETTVIGHKVTLTL